jgi:hypothetical protein
LRFLPCPVLYLIQQAAIRKGNFREKVSGLAALDSLGTAGL